MTAMPRPHLQTQPRLPPGRSLSRESKREAGTSVQLQKTQAGFRSGSGSVINQTVPDVATLVVPITIFYDSSSSQGSIHLDTIFPMSTGIDYVTGSIVGTSPLKLNTEVWHSIVSGMSHAGFDFSGLTAGTRLVDNDFQARRLERRGRGGVSGEGRCKGWSLE